MSSTISSAVELHVSKILPMFTMFHQFGFRLRNLWHICFNDRLLKLMKDLMTCFVTKGQLMTHRDIVNIKVVDTDNLLDFDDMTYGDADFLT